VRSSWANLASCITFAGKERGENICVVSDSAATATSERVLRVLNWTSHDASNKVTGVQEVPMFLLANPVHLHRGCSGEWALVGLVANRPRARSSQSDGAMKLNWNCTAPQHHSIAQALASSERPSTRTRYCFVCLSRSLTLCVCVSLFLIAHPPSLLSHPPILPPPLSDSTNEKNHTHNEQLQQLRPLVQGTSKCPRPSFVLLPSAEQRRGLPPPSKLTAIPRPPGLRR